MPKTKRRRDNHTVTWDHEKDELVRTPITKEPANEAG